MPATIINLTSIHQLHQVADKAVTDNHGKNVFVYFYASIDPATGKSWCPDCVTGTHSFFFWMNASALHTTQRAFLF